MPQRVYVTGHGFVEFPDDAKPSQIHEALLRDFPPPAPTVGETAKSAFGAFAQGGAGVLGSIPKTVGVGLGAITGTEPEQTLPYQFGQGAEDMVESAFPEDPRLKGKSFLWSTLPQAVGSTAGFAATGVGGQLLAPARMAKTAGTAITAATGAAAGGVEGYEDAKRSGADQGSAFASFLLNAGVGTSEALPLGRILDRINVDTKGALKTIVEAGKSAAEEGSQETLQTLAANLVAKNLYDEERDLMNGVLEGGAAGAATGFLMTVLGKGARKALGIPGKEEDATPPGDRSQFVDVDLSNKNPAWQGPPAPPNPSTQPAATPPADTVTVTRSLLEQVQDALKGNQVTATERKRITTPPEPELDETAIAKVSAELSTQDWDQVSGRAMTLATAQRGSWTPEQRIEAEALIASKAIKDGNGDLWRVLRTRVLNEDRHNAGQKPIDHMAAGLSPDQIRLARGDHRQPAGTRPAATEEQTKAETEEAKPPRIGDWVSWQGYAGRLSTDDEGKLSIQTYDGKDVILNDQDLDQVQLEAAVNGPDSIWHQGLEWMLRNKSLSNAWNGSVLHLRASSGQKTQVSGPEARFLVEELTRARQNRNALGISERRATEGLRSTVETSEDDSPVDQAILDAAVEREAATGQPFPARKAVATPPVPAPITPDKPTPVAVNAKDTGTPVISNAAAPKIAPSLPAKPQQNESSLTVPPAATTVQRPPETITDSNEREGSEMSAEGKAETLPPRAPPSSRRRTKAVRENPDLIDIIESTIGSLRVFVARSADRAQRFREMYDSGDYHDFVRTAYGRRLISTKGKYSPDQVVQALISNRDVQPDFSVEDLWRALMNAVRERREGKTAGAAKQSPIDKDAAANADFNRRAIRKTDKAGNVVPAGSLAVGDKFTVDGTNFAVAELEMGQDGELDQVVVEDGRRFGTQRFAGNLYLKPDPASFTPAAGTEPDDNVPFALQAQPAVGMSKADVQAVVDQLADAMPGATTTVVVQSVEDLPKPIRRRGAQGVLWRGRTYLVADNLSNADEASRKWLHEQVGHFGLRAVLGNELKPMLEAVLRAYDGSAEMRRIASTYGLDMTDAADRMEAAEELLAHLAENSSSKPGLWRSVVAAIRRAWRSLTGGEISEDEVKALIARAYRHVESAGLKQERGTARFSLKDQDRDYLAAVERGDTATAQRMVDEAARAAGYTTGPVNHGSGARFNTFRREFAGSITEAASAAEAFFFTSGERTAKAYAVYASEEGPVKALMRAATEAEKVGDWDSYERLITQAEDMVYGEAGADATRARRKNATVYSVFLKGRFLQLDAKGETPATLAAAGDFEEFDGSITAAIKKARRMKFDGVHIRNLDDAPGSTEVADHWAVISPSKIKLSDPVVRDDIGNVIPLSQRFNSDSDDIRFAIKPEEYQKKQAALAARVVAAKSSGNAKDAKAARDEMAQLENEQFGFSAKKSDDEGRSTTPPAAPTQSKRERLSPDQARRAILDVQGATANPTQSVDTWWTQFKKWSRKFATALPELPTSGAGVAQFAAVRRWYRAVSSETDLARKQAERRVKAIIAPIQQLGRETINPNTLAKYEALTNKIQAERAKGERGDPDKIDKWNDLREKLMPDLAPNPWFIFRNVILWRDLAYRVGHLKTEDGGDITPPAGLSLEDVIAQSSEAKLAVEQSPHRAAIEDALKRHYAFVEAMQKELEDHGEIIPEEMKNPDYFPHHILEGWTGRLAPVRATTEGPWRPYMMPITGTVKLHQSDYLAAMYKHAADVLANNAQVDLVERDIKPYDISEQHEANLTERFGADLAKKLLYDQRHLPPGHTVIRPSDRLKLAATYIIDRATLSAKIGKALTDGDLLEQIKSMGGAVNITAEDIREALTVGEQTRWIVPTEVAEALDGISKREQAEANPTFGASLMKPLAKTQQLWKWNILFNPINWVRYEYGNTMTDAIDKIFGLDPAVAKYLKRALKEIRDGALGNPTPEHDAALKEGVFQTVTAAEADQIQKLKEFEEFMSDGEKAVQNWAKLWRVTTGLSALRESTFRYAKFLADLERMEKGERPVYGGAFHGEVEAQQNNYQKAGLISRKTFGDYNDISVAGGFLRKYVFPFWSWSEVNMKYHVNLARNMVDMVKLGDTLAAKNAGRALAVKTTMGAVGIGFRLILIRAAVEAWNQMGGAAAGLWEPDDDLEAQLSEADRRRMHLIMGKDDKGRVRVIYLPNALSDVVEWFGGNNFARLAGDWMKGDISFARFAKDYAKQVPGDFLNKAVQGVRPEAKFAYTMASGKDPFPDVLNQRGVDRADWYWMLGQAVDRDVALALRSQLDPYFYSPESAGDWWQRKILQVRRRDPEQWAYYEVRELASDWKEEKTGKRSEGGLYTSPDQKVVRNFRRAIYNADMENAQKFYHAALDLGYTKDRFKASLRSQDPLSDLKAEERKEFEAGLNDYEKRMLGLAQRYYGRISGGKGKEADLFPKKPGAVFTPRPDRLREMMGAGR